MKKSFFYAGILAAGLMTVSTSCSKDEEIIGGGNNTEVSAADQVIVLDMQDTDVLATKSRPLYSTVNQGAEKVTHVKLFVFEVLESNVKKLVKVLEINDWNNSEAYDYGQKYTLKLKGDDKLEKDKKYTILAVGQDQESKTPSPFQVNGKSLIDLALGNGINQGATWNSGTNAGESPLSTDPVTYVVDGKGGEDLMAKPGNNKSVVGEIFSGMSDPFTIQYEGGFYADVLLKRQVAGVLGNFCRIPAWVPGDNGAHKSVAAIRLVSSARNTQLDLGYNVDKQKDDTTGGKDIEAEVNGFEPSSEADAKFANGNDAYTVYQIDLTKWFRNQDQGSEGKQEYWHKNTLVWNDGDEENLVTPLLGNTWVNPIDQANNMPKVETNAVMAGEFVIPFNRPSTPNETFELQLIDSTGVEVLRTWQVKLDVASQTEKDTEFHYNIYRNHLYQIGKRGGDTDPGKPQPLDKDQILTIKINDQWEFIHDMEIE